MVASTRDMKRWLTMAAAAVVGLFSAFPASANDCGGGTRATALIVDDLDVDGDLSDWPEGLVEHQVGGPAPSRFWVVWSPETDRVYVGIEVEDSQSVIGRNWSSTDATEVFTWGGDPTGSPACEPHGGSRNPIQFAFVPGAGEYVRGCGNPCAKIGSEGHVNPTSQGVRVAWSRRGNTTAYEWALPVFEDYHKGPIELTPGRGIGFDVVITDSDGGRSTLTPWGNPSTQKYNSPGYVATLVLSEERARHPIWSWLADAASATGRFALYGFGLAAVIAVGLAARSVVNGAGRHSGAPGLAGAPRNGHPGRADRLEREVRPPGGEARRARRFRQRRRREPCRSDRSPITRVR